MEEGGIKTTAPPNFNRDIIASPPNDGDVRIIYNPAKNKSKSLGRVGLTDMFNNHATVQLLGNDERATVGGREEHELNTLTNTNNNSTSSKQLIKTVSRNRHKRNVSIQHQQEA